MNNQSNQGSVAKKHGAAFSTIAKFAGIKVNDVKTVMEKRIKK